MTKNTLQTGQDTVVELAKAAIHGIEEKKGKNIKALDLRHIPNTVCDFFIICEGDSTTQVSAIADSVADEVKKLTNKRPHHIEGMQNAEWVLVDYIDVVVHVFQPEVRHFYKLESLWADAAIFDPNGSTKKEKAKKQKEAPLKVVTPSAGKSAKQSSAKKSARVKQQGVKATAKTKVLVAKKTINKKTKVVKKTATKKITKKVKTAVKPAKKTIAKKVTKKIKPIVKAKSAKKVKPTVKKKIANKKKK